MAFRFAVVLQCSAVLPRGSVSVESRDRQKRWSWPARDETNASRGSSSGTPPRLVSKNKNKKIGGGRAVKIKRRARAETRGPTASRAPCLSYRYRGNRCGEPCSSGRTLSSFPGSSPPILFCHRRPLACVATDDSSRLQMRQTGK